MSQVPVCPPALAAQSALEQQPFEEMQIPDAEHFFGVDPPHVKSQAVPSQVGVPPAGAVQGSQRVPHVAVDLLSAQDAAQRC